MLILWKLSYMGRRVDGELQLGLLGIVGGQALHEEGCEPWPGTPTKRVVDKEALQNKIQRAYLNVGHTHSHRASTDDIFPTYSVSNDFFSFVLRIE